MMKMIIAIVNRLDVEVTCSELTKAGFFFTQIGSIGGYLHEGNSTLLIGTEERKVEKAMEIFREYCGKRARPIPNFSIHSEEETEEDSEKNIRSKKCIAGGATVFVLDIEQFEKM